MHSLQITGGVIYVNNEDVKKAMKVYYIFMNNENKTKFLRCK